tara:strand:+ start:40 stop:552 length:513 start_codon:yes stop_codon:yes gene_type:complete
MAIVYQHRRKDDNSVFYIGIGIDVKRAYSKKSRNAHWQNICNKYGYEVDILFTGISYEMACIIEYGLIIDLGRLDLGTGRLVNLTDGGKGSINYKHSKKTIEKISGKGGYKSNRSKEVGKFDLKTNELLCLYGSTREAYKLTGVNFSSISLCCNNNVNYNHAGGYKWKYI